MSEPSSEVRITKAGAFDVRNFIGSLIGLYGIALTIVGLVGFTPDESAKTGGINANLWAGIVMIVVAAFFMVWAKLNPITVVIDPNDDDLPIMH